MTEISELKFYDESSDAFGDNEAKFTEFLEEQSDVYDVKIRDMIDKGQRRLIVDLNDIRRFSSDLGRDILARPLNYVAPFQSALKKYIRTIIDDESLLKQKTLYEIGLEGSFGANKVTPRHLMARFLSQMVCVEGIITKCSLVRPKVIKSVHYCPETEEHLTYTYHDATSMRGFPTSGVYPTKDKDGNALETEFGWSEYLDHQVVTIQEMPEHAPTGVLPSSVDAVLDGDLVDSCKPGDRVQIIGVFRAMASKGAAEGGTFKTLIVTNNVKRAGKQHEQKIVTNDGDIRNIRKLAKRKDVFEIVSRSIAPSIYGHEYIKKSLILFLLGGTEHNLENGTHIRGDINLLMVGDPGTAKSQLLRYVLNIAPLAINTTGRGSSGVGLTAAVIRDRDSGERRLEAGAMVLGDRGVVCIDEFDKMSDADRVAIHEVMEQQTVTIAKAGIHMSLNARCSVLAAANPQYGQYDPYESPMVNVNLPDSLLSRFDLLFIVLDKTDAEIDRRVSDHVIRNHRYINNNEDDGDDLDEGKNDGIDTPVYQKYDRMLHGHLNKGRRGRKRHEILSMTFLKKYIMYAKEKCHPVLSEQASELISDAYATLRTKESENDRTLPVTARSLETLIRLSTALAKLHLQDEVSEQHVHTALDIMKFALHNDIEAPDDGEVEEESSAEEEEEEEEIENEPQNVERSAFKVPPRNKRKTPTKDTPTKRKSIETQQETPKSTKKTKTTLTKELTSDRKKLFQQTLVRYMDREHTMEVDIKEVEELLKDTDSEAFDRKEIEAILKMLENENKVLYKNETIYRI